MIDHGETASGSSAGEAQPLLSLIVDSIADGFYALDALWRFTHANDAALAHFGKAREEILGRSLLEVFPAVRGSMFEREYRRAMESGRPVHFTAASVVAERTVEIHAYPGPGNLTVLFRDVTEQRRMEEALRETRERFQVLSEAMPQIVWSTDASGSFDYFNRRAYEYMGGGPEAIPGWSWTGFIHPDDVELTVARWRRSLETGKTYVVEHRVRGADGEYRWHLSRAVPVRDRADRVVRWIGTSTDIHDQKQVEVRYRSLFDNTSDGVWFIGVDGLIREVNDAYCRMCGYDHDELVGMPVGELEAIESSEDIAEHIRKIIDAGGHDRFESRHRRKGGTIFDVDITALYLEREDLMAIFIRDITERKRAEEALRHANARLVEADLRKNRFLATLSHELRNPLAPVKNSLYVLSHAVPGGDQARRARDVIERQVDQLSRLVDDLLDVTRITHGKIQLQRRRLELNDLVRRTIEDHRSLFDDCGLDVHFDAAPREIFIDADWNRVAQVLGNLLQNAAKFTPAGGRVGVATAIDPEARMAAVRVADTGVGMAAGMLAQIFEPFTQADATLARSMGGLGLGLALAKGLVEQHCGSLEASSEGLGRGSEFTVRLPLDATARAPVERDRTARAKPRRRVLVIEDSVDAADSLREVLEIEGHDVAVAYSGADGVAKARELRPEIVICDIGLPGMDGYEVARTLRADESLRTAHLVALTGYALPDDLRRAREAGFDRHLAKPPSLEQLQGIISGNSLEP